jgi:acetyl/propionyl-CoA carboxylase alpha subunit
VTEAITGAGPGGVAVRVASGGKRLPLAQDQLQMHGHAIEAHVFVPRTGRQFLPATGSGLTTRHPHHGV